MCLAVHRGEYLGRYPRTVTPPGRYTPLGRCTPRAGTPWQVHPSPGAVHAGRYWQQAGGTHPTGMHSCYVGNLHIPFSQPPLGFQTFGESLIPIKMWFHKNPLIVKILSFQIILSRDCFFSHKGNHMKESTIAA